MKTKLKRLMAVLMAVAMVLSLSVTAFASEDDGDTREVFENLTVGDTEAGSSGETEGSSTTEGRIPDDPIDIILPVVPEITDGPGLFDIYLDPHELITKTNAARYEESLGATETTFAADQRLYFQSDPTDESELVYSGDSKTLTITNMGRLPVTVDLNVDLTYDKSAFTLVAAKEDLTDSTKAPNAAMFLGLKLGEDDPKAILEPAANAIPATQVHGKGDYFTSVTFEFADGITADNKTSLLTALKDTSIAAEYTAAVVESGVVTTPAKVIVTPTLPSGFSAGDAVEVAEPDTGKSDKTVAFTVKKGDDTVATITVKVLAPNRKTMKAEQTQTINFFPHAVGTGKATIRTAISALTEAYKEHWADLTTFTDNNPAPQGITDKGYYWDIPAEDRDALEFPSISFKLTGDINSDILWDEVSDEEVNFVLTWDVFEYDNAMYRNVVAFGDGAEGGATRLSGTAPTIEVTKMASSGTTTAAKTVTITWTPGTGDYAAYVPSPTVALNNGGSLTMTIDNTAHTLKITNATTTSVPTGVTGTVVFTADGLPDIELETTALR